MKPRFNKSTSPKVIGRIKKKIRIRRKVFGTVERPRLCVFRSTNHMYAQLIDDVSGNTLVAASSLVGVDSGKPGLEIAKAVGTLIAQRASEKEIQTVVFDRSGFIYHGRIKALADAAREAGLKF